MGSGNKAKKAEKSSQKHWMVFFDFDNTITSTDILDNIIERFSVNDDWKAVEELWVQGKIGSRECLEKQLQGVRITQQDLSEYLSTIMIDPSFGKLLTLLGDKGVQSLILSDSFTFIIREILRHNGIHGIKIFANELKFSKDRIAPYFPHINPECLRCAHCKTKHVTEYLDRTTVYVGDGLSDVCPAQRTNLVFAKATLMEFFKKNQKPFMEFKELKDVCSFFEDLEPLCAEAPRHANRKSS